MSSAGGKEPSRLRSLISLKSDFRGKIKELIENVKELGYDPVVFETLRTKERQSWLYGIGRHHHMTRRPVTWTLKSRHLDGEAADIISASRLWNWPRFFYELGRQAGSLGLETLPQDQGHVQWRRGREPVDK